MNIYLLFPQHPSSPQDNNNSLSPCLLSLSESLFRGNLYYSNDSNRHWEAYTIPCPRKHEDIYYQCCGLKNGVMSAKQIELKSVKGGPIYLQQQEG